VNIQDKCGRSALHHAARLKLSKRAFLSGIQDENVEQEVLKNQKMEEFLKSWRTFSLEVQKIFTITYYYFNFAENG
jgi:hypothetical protein